MKRFLMILAAVMFVAVGCDNSKEQYDPDKNKPEVDNNGDNGGNGGNNGDNGGDGGTEENAAPWAALADSCTTVLIENFLNKDTGTFWSTPNDVMGETTYIYWQQAHAMDVIIYSYKRVKKTDPELAKKYLGYMRKWVANDANNYNNTYDNVGDYGGFFNDFTDDMCWICLTLIHMSKATGEMSYLQIAKDVYDNYIWPRAVTDAKGTGLPWKGSDRNPNSRNACTNAPGCLVAALLYNEYKGDYLDKAVTLYNYCIANMPDEERVEEPPLTYTQGTFGEACRQLYKITKEQKYMTKAGQVLLYAFQSNRCTNTEMRVLRHEGESMDQSLFKAVLIPYAVNYILDENAAPYTARVLKELVYNNAQVLSKNLNRKLYPRMYAGYFWGEPFKGTVASMGAQTSGASLMEGAARLEAAEK
jgi:predicted alpha-1,6-mannanase (GH76 family)